MSFNFGGPSSPFKPKYFRPTAQPVPAPVQPGLPTLKPQEQYLQNKVNAAPSLANQAAAAAGAGRAASTASTAASTAGQPQQQAQGATMANAAATAQPSGYSFNGVTYATESDMNMAKAAAGAGRAAQVGSTAASQVGQQQQQAQGDVMGSAANTAAAPAGVQPTPAQDFSLTKQPWITESGRLYERGVEDRLKGVDPLVKNAQNTANTNASRSNYYARTNAQEGAAQAKYQPGTVQYQRMMDESQAGANAAGLAGQNQVNDFTRQRSAEANDMARGLESTAYGMAKDKQDFQLGERAYTDNRGDIKYQRDVAEEDKAYTRGITERTYKDTQALLAKGDINGLIAAMPTQKGKNRLTQVLASGGDVKAALAEMFNPDNSLKTEYRDNSPVADVRAQAEEWINLVSPGLDPAAKEAAIVKRMQDLDAAKQDPIEDATTARTLQEIKGMLDTGKPLEPTETEAAIKGGLIPPLAVNTVPTGAANVTRFIQQNPSGKFALNGQVYTLVKGSSPRTGRTEYTNSPRHTDVAEVKDASGKTLYFYNGAVHDAYPKTVGDTDITPFGW